MVKIERKKRKGKRVSFKLRRSTKILYLPNLIVLKVLLIIGILAALAALLYFAEKHLKSARPVGAGPLILVDVPNWVNEQIKARVFTAAGGRGFRLDEQAAKSIAKNLASAGWLDQVKVQTTHDSIRVKGIWRKPLASVKSGFYKFYVDNELIVLDFVPIPNLPIVQVKGVSVTIEPLIGQKFERDDLAAAVAILRAMEQMDKTVTPDKPLLKEIDSIDVSNFDGRQDNRQPHIILYAKDNTEIIWGAEFGNWQKFLEATDEQKLAKLYSYYKEYGTLLGGVKYINLRDPQDNVPLPVDKY